MKAYPFLICREISTFLIPVFLSSQLYIKYLLKMQHHLKMTLHISNQPFQYVLLTVGNKTAKQWLSAKIVNICFLL